jgi:hypothetical protein
MWWESPFNAEYCGAEDLLCSDMYWGDSVHNDPTVMEDQAHILGKFSPYMYILKYRITISGGQVTFKK